MTPGTSETPSPQILNVIALQNWNEESFGDFIVIRRGDNSLLIT